VGRPGHAGVQAAAGHVLTEWPLTARRACGGMHTVPDYDAFGREIGDDPLKNLREVTNPVPPVEAPRAEVSAREPPTATPDPDVEAWSAAHEPGPQPVVAPPLQFVRPRRRRRGGLAGLLVLAAIIGGLGLAANSVVEQGEDLIDRISPALPDAEPDAAPPTGLQARSLIREDNYAAALETLADSGLGRPASIRLAPERLDAQLLKGGKLHIVQVTPDGELREFGTSDGSGRTIAYAAIDPAAPERLVRRAATRKSPARSINYLVISPGPPLAVNAYFKSGRIVLGDAHGRVQRVL